MELKKVDVKEFQKNLYKEYKKIFPSAERKSLGYIKKLFVRGNLEILEILDEDKIVGFFITNILKNNPYVILDYFAIFPENQSKGYGSKAINLLKETYNDYDGIYIEVEKVNDNEQDGNKQRRIKFYERLGFQYLGYDIDLFNVIFSTYLLPINMVHKSDQYAIDKIIEIYKSIFGNFIFQKKCKFIKIN